jgi:hypothetical protein
VPDATATADAPIDAAPPCPDASPAAMAVDCDAPGACASIAVAGDPPNNSPGSFEGLADPSLYADPAVTGRIWLAYSWLRVQPGQDPGGATVQMATVENHLARSDDGGATFVGVGDLWPAVPLDDPEGSGETGMIPSETASLVAIESGGVVTWYGAHLRYFLRPITGYHPRYGTSWQVRIGAAATPQGLATAPETVLGVSTTAAVYQPRERLDQLAGLPIQHCAMLNNPTLYADAGTLYLIVECLAFVGQAIDHANSSVQVFATTPTGAPTTWTWRYAGELADHALAQQLGSDTIQQPDVSRAADGTPILVITPAHDDPASSVGTVGDGCVAVELDAIDPPAVRRDCAGNAVVRARVEGASVAACSHAPASITGLVGHSHAGDADDYSIHRTGVRP